MKILNLYAGLGGNRKLWAQDHGQVTAVEKNHAICMVYQKLYPNDRVVCADAHQFLLDHHSEYDFAWSSPPCQPHSKMVKFTPHKLKRFPDLKLYEEIIFLDHFFKGKWVVENVFPYYKPLIEPTKRLGRHLFWANFDITNFEHKQISNFIGRGNSAESEELKKWLGIDYKGNLYYNGNNDPNQVLRNCVHPLVGESIFNDMLRSLQTSNQ